MSGNRDPRTLRRNQQSPRRAVGYVRVSTDMQAAEECSRCAAEATESYCAMMGNQAGEAVSGRDVGRKDVRPGLARRCGLCKLCGCSVLKFGQAQQVDRALRELYETYFKDGRRNWLRFGNRSGLDSSPAGSGGNPLVFAQMERRRPESTRERDWTHPKRAAITLGRCRGKRTVPAPDHPRMKILVEDEGAENHQADQRVGAKA